MLKLLTTFICAMSPLFCEAEAAGPGEIMLTTTNSYTFRGEVNDSSVSKAQLELARLNFQRGKATWPIYLVLDSPGGSVYAGMSFIEYAETIPNLQTITIFAASMAAGIVEALPGKRNITRMGVLMFHRASGGFQGQFETGELESQLAFWKSIVLQMEVTNSDRIGISLADYKAKAKDEWWMLGSSAVKQGAADSLIKIKCTQRLIDSREKMTVEGFFSSVEYSFSKCPLFQNPL